MKLILTFEDFAKVIEKNYKGRVVYQPELTEKAKVFSEDVFVSTYDEDEYSFFFVDKQLELSFNFSEERLDLYCFIVNNHIFTLSEERLYKDLIEKCTDVLKDIPKLRLLFITGLIKIKQMGELT